MKATLLIFMAALLLFAGCGNNKDENVIEGTGTIEATNVTLSAKTSGQIRHLLFIEGQTVKAGDTLLIIDTEALNIQLKQLEAGTEVSKAQLEQMRNGARKEDISQAESALQQAEINYKQAKLDFERMKNLTNENAIARKQFDDAQARLDIATAQYQSAKDNFSKVKNITRPEELRQAMGRFNQSQANAELIKKNINDSFIISPINGIVTQKFFEEGESVSPMSSLVKVSDLSMVELYIYVPQTELAKIKYGDYAEVKIDAFENKSYKGKVVYISPEAEFTPKNIQTKDERTKLVFGVKLSLENPGYELKPGMPADAKIYTKTK